MRHSASGIQILFLFQEYPLATPGRRRRRRRSAPSAPPARLASPDDDRTPLPATAAARLSTVPSAPSAAVPRPAPSAGATARPPPARQRPGKLMSRTTTSAQAASSRQGSGTGVGGLHRVPAHHSSSARLSAASMLSRPRSARVALGGEQRATRLHSPLVERGGVPPVRSPVPARRCAASTAPPAPALGDVQSGGNDVPGAAGAVGRRRQVPDADQPLLASGRQRRPRSGAFPPTTPHERPPRAGRPSPPRRPPERPRTPSPVSLLGSADDGSAHAVAADDAPGLVENGDDTRPSRSRGS